MEKKLTEQRISEMEFGALGYGYNMLEPFIDGKTMELHHGKHHQAYFTNMQKWAGEQGMGDVTLAHLFGQMGEHPAFIRNNAGGHYNHHLFWRLLKLNGGAEPGGTLAEALRATFGSVQRFRELFAEAAATRFGSGWAWLTLNSNGALEVSSTPNQDNPLMADVPVKGKPILALDVWEHAYYLKYQNRRPEYIEAFWSVVNWAEAERLYQESISR
jgi:superoxide dismutase, Fe-Mn family